MMERRSQTNMTECEHDRLMSFALKYCRLRVLPWDELNPDERVDYAYRRNAIHTRISEILDVDRELVEQAFSQSESKMEELSGVFDSFMDELERLAGLSERERHPDSI